MFDMTNVNAFSSAEQMKGGCLLKIRQLRKILHSSLLHWYNRLTFSLVWTCTCMALMTLNETGLHCTVEPNKHLSTSALTATCPSGDMLAKQLRSESNKLHLGNAASD